MTRRRRSEPYLDDPLLRELIPRRITPPPPTTDGPTARWMAEHPELPLLAQLKAVGE